MLKSPTVMLLSVSPFVPVNICFTYLTPPVLGAYIYNCYIFLDWSLDHYVVSFFVYCYSLCFKVCFVWYKYCYPGFLLISICMEYLFFYPLTFSLYVPLDLKWVSYRQRIYGSYFCISSATLCLLVGAFSPFTFKVIIDRYILIAILLIVLGLFL